MYTRSLCYGSMDTEELPANGNAVAARAARVPRVSAARAHLRALGADRTAAGSILPLQALRWQIAAGTYNYTPFYINIFESMYSSNCSYHLYESFRCSALSALL